jgi:hypothetical protein
MNLSEEQLELMYKKAFVAGATSLIGKITDGLQDMVDQGWVITAKDVVHLVTAGAVSARMLSDEIDRAEAGLPPGRTTGWRRRRQPASRGE